MLDNLPSAVAMLTEKFRNRAGDYRQAFERSHFHARIAGLMECGTRQLQISFTIGPRTKKAALWQPLIIEIIPSLADRNLAGYVLRFFPFWDINL